MVYYWKYSDLMYFSFSEVPRQHTGFCPFMCLWNRYYLHFFPFFKHFINVFIALIKTSAILKKRICETKWKSKCESLQIQYTGENWATMHHLFLSEIFVLIQRKNFGYFPDVFRHWEEQWFWTGYPICSFNAFLPVVSSSLIWVN